MRINFILHKSINMGPVKYKLNKSKEIQNLLKDEKHWYTKGDRCACIAAQLLLNKKIIALPTDTIYGIAGLAQEKSTIEKLYVIKKRDVIKPLSICLSEINDIHKWAEVDDVPYKLIDILLPGPVTIVLKRKNTLNSFLNKGIENIGIRVPNSLFIRKVIKMINQPIALTSANLSKEQSTVHPTEFEHLWPLLDGIFYETLRPTKRFCRTGSTVVDLTIAKQFKILRKGFEYQKVIKIFNYFGFTEQSDNKDKEKYSEEIETVSVAESKSCTSN